MCKKSLTNAYLDKMSHVRKKLQEIKFMSCWSKLAK